MDVVSINSIPPHKRERSLEIATEVQAHLATQGRIKCYSKDAKKYAQKTPIITTKTNKLSKEEVLEVRRQYRLGISVPELAAAYGVTQVQIKRIVQKKAWEHLH